MKFYWLTIIHCALKLFSKDKHDMIDRKPLYQKHRLYHCTCGYLDPTNWEGRPPKEWKRK